MDTIISMLLGNLGEQFTAKLLTGLLRQLKGLAKKTSTKLDDEAIDMLINALNDATGATKSTS
jgi:hypothetical protein